MKKAIFNSEAGIPEHFTFEKITPSENFVSTVMDRIEADKTESFSSLSSVSKAVLLSLIIVIYSSIGVFIGVQEHRNSSFNISESREKAINDLRAVHHLDPVSSFDKMLKPF